MTAPAEGDTRGPQGTAARAPLGLPVPLLDAIVRDALDPSYADAAARSRRADRRVDGARAHHRASGLVLIAAAGLVIGLAVAFQHKTLPQVTSARQALAGDASATRRQVQTLERQLAALHGQVTALQREQLRTTQAGRAAQALAETLAASVGRTPVTGPGVTVTISDAAASRVPSAGSRPADPATAAGVVTDRDLQNVVNALWAGGAEAIAVGGIRLGPLTAIRTAGQTILVQFRALASPYRITAVGGPGLRPAIAAAPAIGALQQGPAGAHPQVAIATSPTLTLPAAAAAEPAAASPLIPGGHS